MLNIVKYFDSYIYDGKCLGNYFDHKFNFLNLTFLFYTGDFIDTDEFPGNTFKIGVFDEKHEGFKEKITNFSNFL